MVPQGVPSLGIIQEHKEKIKQKLEERREKKHQLLNIRSNSHVMQYSFAHRGNPTPHSEINVDAILDQYE